MSTGVLRGKAMQNGLGYEQQNGRKLEYMNTSSPFHYESQWLQWGDTKMDKVLVIEDEPSIAMLLANIIEEYGYEVITAFDGKRGFELARTGQFKLVITDNMLPYMTGHEICARLHHEPQACGTVVILMSAVTNLAETSTEAEAFLSKPFDISTVDQLVQRFLVEPNLTRQVSFDDGAAHPVENYNHGTGYYHN